MMRNWKLSTIAVAALAALVSIGTFAPVASARPPVVFIHGGFYGGYWGPGPFYYGPEAAYGYAPGPYAGKVKIETKLKEATVYIDGGYAGTLHDLKTFPMRPGTHNIELRAPDGRAFFQQTVDVIAGKTTKIYPDLH